MADRKHSRPLDNHVFANALTMATQAISGKKDLSIGRGNQLFATPLDSSDMIILHEAGEGDDSDPKRYLRGQCDMAALSLRLHNRSIHQKHRPQNDKAAGIYDALEQMRVESIGINSFDGMKQNLQHRAEVYCEIQGFSRMSEQADPPFADIISMVLREKLTGVKPPKSIRPLVNMWRPWVEDHGKNLLKKLDEASHNQEEFAKLARKLLQRLDLLPKTEQASQPSDPTPNDESDGENKEAGDSPQEDKSEYESATPSSGQQERSDDQENIKPMEGDDSDQQSDGAGEKQVSHAPNRPNITPYKQVASYKIFTRLYDEVIDADQLASSEELARLREQLDLKLKDYHNVHSRLATRLQRLLMAQQTREWLYEQEDGLIDSARLARLVVNPDIREIYKFERDSDFRDTIVTLLIDNSGSMRGRPITIAALSVDILARTLERCGVKVEILGFTTRDWKGGMARKSWERQGKPRDPGRLNDLRHIIYKSADMRLNKTRRNLGLMLKDGILKENIDGEALLWAHKRLLARPEQRRILMVISDGAPVDDSTLSTNSSGYLDRHLREVIEQIEEKSDVELTAIGIGHDVTRYYKHAVTINDVEQLGDTMLQEMTKLFAEK